MDALLDTHAMLWFIWDDPQLSAVARTFIADPSNQILVSVASCWEIAIKVSVGKMKLGEPAQTFLLREIPRNRFGLLPITLTHATGVESLPLHHRDPFDRLLISQALAEKLPIVGVDAVVDAYGVQRIW